MRVILVIVLLSMFGFSCKNQPEEPVSKTRTKANENDIAALYEGYYKNPTTLAEKEQNQIIDYAMDKELPFRKTKSGLFLMLTREGVGPALVYGEKVRAHYKGYYLNGVEFDSSYKRGKAIDFYIGQMMNGWNEAFTYYRSGSKGKIIVPSRLAYGEAGYPEANIPPNSILAFDIEVLF